MLTQRRLFTTFTFSFVPGGVDVTERHLTASRSYRVPFENIPPEPIKVSLASPPLLWATIVLFGLAVLTAGLKLGGDSDVERDAWAFWGVLGVATAIWFSLSRRRFLIFKFGEPGLTVMANRPSVAAVAAFLDELHQRRRAYFDGPAPLGGPTTPTGGVGQKLAWLRDNGILSTAEFEQLTANTRPQRHDAPPDTRVSP